MNCLLIRFDHFHLFFVPFTEKITGKEVKEEMQKQLRINNTKMMLIYDGKILPNEIELISYGLKHGSILHLYIPNFYISILKDPRRMVNEILSILYTLDTFEAPIRYKALMEIKSYAYEPSMQALVDLLPELKCLFKDIDDLLIETSESNIIFEDRLCCKFEDNFFSHFESSIVDNYITLEKQLLAPSLMADGDRLEDGFDDIKLDINYKPSINSNPLPYPFHRSFR